MIVLWCRALYFPFPCYVVSSYTAACEKKGGVWGVSCPRMGMELWSRISWWELKGSKFKINKRR